MNAPALRRVLSVFLLLLVPVAWISGHYSRYIIDGDAVAYMDIADLLHRHHWAGVVNAYWHPLYPAVLALAQVLFHPSRMNEVGAYISINFVIFLAQIAAMWAFVSGLVRLRDRSSPDAAPLLSLNAMRLLGVALLVVATQRELALALVRPDALLQALFLAAFAMLLHALATTSAARASVVFPAMMGLFFGLAYLTKSFAFVVALLSIATLVLFQWLDTRRTITTALLSGATAFVVFALIAGPYVSALSHQKHRLTFGDSGNLNYAWYVGNTEKMHLEPNMTSSFGAADVHLLHPEQQLLASPGVYSYKALPYGTYPPWFDTTYFNDHIVPHMHLHDLAVRDKRNIVLVFRYIFNHPEAPILFALFLLTGASLRSRSADATSPPESTRTAPLLRSRWLRSFWLPPVTIGIAIWLLYGMVNVEERYVTVGYLLILLPLFAALRAPAAPSAEAAATEPRIALRPAANLLIALFAFLALGESLRLALDERRHDSVAGLAHTWINPDIYGAAEGLQALGVRPGDEIACVGTIACLNDHYWARLAQTRLLTEVYAPEPHHLMAQLQSLPDLQQVYSTVRAQGARVLVGAFDPGEMNPTVMPAAAGWIRLGETHFYALPLNLQPVHVPPAPAIPFSTTAAGAKP